MKALVENDDWAAIGRAYNFTPKYHEGFKRLLDWRCIPERVVTILRGRRKWIVRATKPTRTKPYTKTWRDYFYEKQEGVCFYCAEKVQFEEWTIEHRQPRSRGGGNSIPNIVGACKRCNYAKQHLTEEEFIPLLTAGSLHDLADRCEVKIKELAEAH